MVKNMMAVYILLATVIFSPIYTSIVTATKLTFRGIPPSEMAYYSSPQIMCRDGSRTLPVERVNDDFCDCMDGTDEPGTSACPTGHFYCANKGHVPLVVFSSRVNDGICDCCDGSDEYTGLVTCKNKCIEEGAASRKALQDDIVKFSEGAKIRSSLVEETVKKTQEWKEEIEKLRIEKESLKSQEAKLLEQKTAIEKVEQEVKEKEEQARREKEEEERVSQEAEGKTDEAESHEEVGAEDQQEQNPEGSEALPVESEGSDQSSEEAQIQEADNIPESSDMEEFDEDHFQGGEEEHLEDGEGQEVEHLEAQMQEGALEEAALESGKPSEEDDEFKGLSEAEIGKRIASRWTGGGEETSSAEETPEQSQDGEGDKQHPEEEVEEDEAPEQGGHDEEEDYDASRDGEQDFEAEEGENEAEESGEKSEGEDNLSASDSESDRVKKQYNKVSQERQKVESRLTKLEKKLQMDFGTDGEFSSFADQCFKLKVNQYDYEVCPYHKATQHEGHINTKLGVWRGFDKNYSKMTFKFGDQCWNGPQRSLTISLECGLENQLSAVGEPSRCEYTAVLATPAACKASKAEELKKALDEKLMELREIHDEL